MLRRLGRVWQVPWKCDVDNEDKIKAETKATIRCYPFEHNKAPPAGAPLVSWSGVCTHCTNEI